MDKLIVTGNGPLNGEVRISGAKNAVLPILMSSLLVDGKLKISNVPHLHDITTTVSLLGQLGVQFQVDEISKNTPVVYKQSRNQISKHNPWQVSTLNSKLTKFRKNKTVVR